MTPRPFSKHLFTLEGRTLYGWWAWDTLFLPRILGKTAHVESTDAETGSIVRMTVTPDEVRGVDPATAVMSILEPRDDMMDDVVARLCHFIYFFPHGISASLGPPRTRAAPCSPCRKASSWAA